MEMTLIYAKIANRVAADEYAAASAKIDALYGQPPALPADYETTGMARLRREAHARMLGNGLCTRPAELDCRFESACETCAWFRTGTEFLPIRLPAGKVHRSRCPALGVVVADCEHRSGSDARACDRLRGWEQHPVGHLRLPRSAARTC
jgi:hypothetical protein